MGTSLENYVEQLAVLLLEANSTLTAIIPASAIVRESEDADTVKDRIVCKAMPAEVEVFGRTMETVKVWRIPLDITVYFSTDSAANMDAVIAEIRTAIRSTADNAAAQAIINTAKIAVPANDTSEGDFSTEENARKRTKRFNFLAEP